MNKYLSIQIIGINCIILFIFNACTSNIHNKIRSRDLVFHVLKYDTLQVENGSLSSHLFEEVKYKNGIEKATNKKGELKFSLHKIKFKLQGGEIDTTNGKIAITRDWLYKHNHQLKVDATIRHKGLIYFDSTIIKFPQITALKAFVCEDRMYMPKENAIICYDAGLTNGKILKSTTSTNDIMDKKYFKFYIDGNDINDNQWIVPSYFDVIKTKLPVKVIHKLDSTLYAFDTLNISFKSNTVLHFDGENGRNGDNGSGGSDEVHNGSNGDDGKNGRKSLKVAVQIIGEIYGNDTLLDISIYSHDKTERLILDPKGGRLKVTANGGDGGKGGDGGYASNGRDADKSKNIDATRGGFGGKGGDGGDGGDAGEIKVFIDPAFSKFTRCMTFENRPGKAGLPGKGGSNGRDGLNSGSKSLLSMAVDFLGTIILSGKGEDGKDGREGEKNDAVEIINQSNEVMKQNSKRFKSIVVPKSY